MSVTIIGGGIAGLALALWLKQHGKDVTIYEAAPEIRELGVGITLLPHAMQEIAKLGLREKIEAIGVPNKYSAFFNRFGQKVFEEPRGLLAGYNVNEIGIHRGKLHATLLEAVRERLPVDALKTDHRLSSFTQDDDGVTLSFVRTSNGEALPDVRAEYVVGCDGVNSAVRKTMHPNDAVAFAGINTWRGVTRRKPFLDGRTYARIGTLRTGKMVIYPIIDYPDGTQLINWVAELRRDDWQANEWNIAGDTSDVLPIFKAYRFDWLDVAELIAEAESVIEYPMVDKDPLETWREGRVTLLGDAAHPMYPRGSNGSAQGFIDARVLAEHLASASDPIAAFDAYEADRRPKTSAVVLANRSNPPDVIIEKVEEVTQDKPFEDLDDFVTQDELSAISQQYKKIAGFTKADLQHPVVHDS
ncbi:MAG: flavin-dependent oxidoreductase [Pacificimonas sp.]|jgi:2-polyprenyl-6-methoxyphenol hydroxylase-like FAD-dependent oxidoreductase|nr:flavin-dependent oxidoreductase [Pacificimonas sp.]